MASLLAQLPLWAGVTLATWVACWLTVSPQTCQDQIVCNAQMQTYPAYYHVISSTALVAMAGNEICGLIATFMGARQTQELIPHLKSRCLPSFLLALMFAWLAVVERFFSRPEATLAHVHTSADGMTEVGRPVYTLRYIEWCINVPILFLLSGHCSLGRPLREVSRPLVVTNIYIIFSWMATVTQSGILKWFLIVLAFHMYGWASMDMLAWSRAFERSAPRDLPSRRIRPWLSNGLIIHFQFFGAIYMASVVGVIDAETEQLGYFVVTFGAKIAYCATFVFIRADEYHKTLTDVLKKVSVSNVGMISILRGSFDIIVPCVLDAAGRCKLPSQMSGDMWKLEKMLNCKVASANLKDLLQDQDQEDFVSYVRNVVRQADCPQAFSEATLTTSGIWSCGANVMPPIAQVLHSKMQAAPGPLRARLHLSVVPRSAVTSGKERHLVAAIQFGDEEGGELEAENPKTERDKEADTADTGFGNFKAEDRQTSTGSTHVSDGLIANLADLTKLGASLGDDGSEDGDSWECSMSDKMSHLGAFAEAPSVDARICGVWQGKTSESLGGYSQRIEVETDCYHASITVMGQTMPALVHMNCAVEPKQLDISVVPTEGAPSPPTIPYIFRFGPDGSLQLCGPVDHHMRRPSTFRGPGLCVMERVPEPLPETGKTPQKPEKEKAPFEPDPEFSRTNTEEPPEATIDQIVQDLDFTLPGWKESAVVAVALTGAFMALRKSV
mmetsp:Transcript_48549/g.113323  ORF Transcript_48549/g.113323 Transcript_48549/m.113323 type:complete len:726 (-) Transcript_48549:215-2392(-)